MNKIQERKPKDINRPVKVLQFGEGNFLRAFADNMIDEANAAENFDGSIVLLKPRPSGDLTPFRSQNCVYTVLNRGIKNGEIVDTSRVITSIKEILNTTSNYKEYMDYAKCPTIEFVISNTTEAGIVFDDKDLLSMEPPASFPGKVTQFLYNRFTYFNGDLTKGITFLPVELIDDNGTALKNCILKTAQSWNLPSAFTDWINSSCVFCNTLVDRIVTGFPKQDYENLTKQLGYEDKLMVAAEPFALWVIESSDPTLAEKFPLEKAGLPVVFTSDCKPYKKRKVRILNGAHTSFSLAAYLLGKNFVREALDDSVMRTFIEDTIFDEIIPATDIEKEILIPFAKSVIERFQNPFIDHQLLSISLNSVSKWKTRCLPSLLDYCEKFGTLPKHLVFSLSALLAFYQGQQIVDGKMECYRENEPYYVSDSPEVLDFFMEHCNDNTQSLVQAYLAETEFHGEDLNKIPGLTEMTTEFLILIKEKGIKAAIESLHQKQKDFLLIHPDDNAAVCLHNIKKGSVFQEGKYKFEVIEDIPQGHKIACRDLNEGEKIVKYGAVIGTAQTKIPTGSHIHTHNMKTCLSGELTYVYAPTPFVSPAAPQNLDKSFMGYPRKYGNAGIRNHIFIIPTVGCVNKIARLICDEAKKQFSHKKNIDKFICLEHPYGCSQLGDDQQNTQKILADLCTHPNVGGVLLLGLGCENSNIEEIKKHLKEYDDNRIAFLEAQKSEDEISEGLSLIEKLVNHASLDVREEIPLSQLVIGLKCGGSDGLSGITANPLVGRFSDWLIHQGGSAILTEVPEMFGAETILMNRCKDEATFEKLKNLINEFKEYYISQGQNIYENPSPGNKAGGISTLEDKSLGCTQKAGTSAVSDVLSYGEKITCTGLSILSAPGNDLVAATALASAGAQLILFTTGRGTPFSAPVPTMKISTNTALAEKKSGWIDFDAGRLLQDKDLNELTKELYQKVISIANGEPVKSETLNLFDMAIFKKGVTL